MICKDCGAEYDDTLIGCPFCGAENVEESYRRQAAYVNDLKKKNAFMSMLPEWIVRCLGKLMKHTAILAVGIFLVVLLVAFLGTKIYSSTAIFRMERNIARLENLYDAGDYDKLKDVYWDMEDTYGGSYEKYARTVNVYSQTEWIMYNMEKLSGNYVKYVTAQEVEDMLEDLVSVLHKIDAMEEADFPYGEEKAMLEFRNILEEGRKEHLPLDEGEFQSVYDKYVEDGENNYTEEAALILKRAIGEK